MIIMIIIIIITNCWNEVYCYYFIVSSNMLVQSIANYCVMFGRYSSFIGANALLCYDRYNWSLSELISNPEHIKYFSFKFCK